MAGRIRNKRATIAIILLSVALTAAIAIIIIGMFITGRQGSNPLFRVTYQARAVNAEVQGTYRLEGATEVTYMKSATGEDFISFDSSDTEATTKSLSMEDTVDFIENVSSYILFTYTFTNKNRSRDLRITMSDNATKLNVRVYYATSEEITGENFEETLNYLNTTQNTDNNQVVTCPKATEYNNPSIKIFVLVSLVDKYDDAFYETGSNNEIRFLLESLSQI